MKRYRYSALISLGNTSTLETETMRKSMSSFLRAFQLKPDIEKVEYEESPESAYYYLADVKISNYNILPVLQFAESLRSFCLYWRMSLEEYGIFEEDVSSL